MCCGPNTVYSLLGRLKQSLIIPWGQLYIYIQYYSCARSQVFQTVFYHSNNTLYIFSETKLLLLKYVLALQII